MRLKADTERGKTTAFDGWSRDLVHTVPPSPHSGTAASFSMGYGAVLLMAKNICSAPHLLSYKLVGCWVIIFYANFKDSSREIYN
jgi:hypothetical protein